VAATVVLFIVVLEAVAGDTLVSFANDLFVGLSAIPRWIVQGFAAVARCAAVAVLVLGVVQAVREGRWSFLARSGAGAVLGASVYALVALSDLSSGGSAPVDGIVVAGFPSAIGLAAIGGALTAAAPWLSRFWRQASWILLIGLALVRFMATPVAFDTVEAVAIGWLAGAAALVVLGGPQRRPTAAAIASGLADVGFALSELEPAAVDARGSTPFLGTSVAGEKLFVKALGDDERSADLLFRLYRKATHRKFGDEPAFSTLRRAVEHEALVALAARDVGIATPRFLALARAEPNGFVLVYEAVAGRSLDRLEAAEMTDELLASVWGQVAQLRSHGIAHRDFRLANVFRDASGATLLIDFGFSELAASSLLLATDVAELLASTATVVGPARAVSAATAVVGSDVVRSAVPRLETRYLSGATRTAIKEQPETLTAVRALAQG